MTPSLARTAAAAGTAGTSLRVRWLGRVEFGAALALQEEIVREHARFGDTLLLLEHEPVYTTGRAGRVAHLPGAREGGTGEIPVVRIGRGGDVTFHGPGQLVGYALVDLRARGGDVHRFLRALEAGVIASLGGLGVAAVRWPGRTGVWVQGAPPALPGEHAGAAVAPAEANSLAGGGARKIASIGIGVRRGISMHGFALNLSVDLRAFDSIVPCGIEGVRMTSVEKETGRAPSLETAAASAAERVAQALDEAAPAADAAEGRRVLR